MTRDPFAVDGKVIVVTGGTRGLGREISLELAAHGAHIIAGYFQNEESAGRFLQDSANQGYACSTVKANLMTTAGVQNLCEQAISRHGKVDALVYNCATGVHKPLAELSSRHFSGVWQLNVGAFFDLATRLRAHMPRDSRIVAISSEGARRAVHHYGTIGSSKAALEALCRQMSAEWAAAGISVNVVSPGLLETDSLAVMGDREARIQQEISGSPLGRLVTPEEVAHVVHFLCSSASTGIDGQTIIVDGGKSISALSDLKDPS